MAEQAAEKAIDEMSFEEALEELEKIVGSLEGGNVPLDQSIARYERGEKLRAHCQELLAAAEAKVEKIRVGADGKAAGSEPLDE